MALATRKQRSGFAVACLLPVLVFLFFAARIYSASHSAAALTQAGLERAIRLEPTDAEYHYQLGRLLSFQTIDRESGLNRLREAVARNPHRSDYWLTLASAYQLTGNDAQQQQALDHALRAAPTSPSVAWVSGNFYLLHGETLPALRLFRVVLQSKLVEPADVLQLAWRASGDADQIVREALPDTPEAHAAFLSILSQNNDLKSSSAVWKHWMTLSASFEPQLAFPYLQMLLKNRDVAGAQQAWRELSAHAPALQGYAPQPPNLVVNAGFEQDILDGGFTWQYTPLDAVTIQLDSSQMHSGTRSLLIALDGDGIADAGISQPLPVEPNRTYELAGFVKSEEILGGSGPRLAAVDYYSSQPLGMTDDVLGSVPWQQLSALVRTGPDTRLIAIKVVRAPYQSHVRGKLWLDDVSFVPQ